MPRHLTSMPGHRTPDTGPARVVASGAGSSPASGGGESRFSHTKPRSTRRKKPTARIFVPSWLRVSLIESANPVQLVSRHFRISGPQTPATGPARVVASRAGSRPASGGPASGGWESRFSHTKPRSTRRKKPTVFIPTRPTASFRRLTSDSDPSSIHNHKSSIHNQQSAISNQPPDNNRTMKTTLQISNPPASPDFKRPKPQTVRMNPNQ